MATCAPDNSTGRKPEPRFHSSTFMLQPARRRRGHCKGTGRCRRCAGLRRPGSDALESAAKPTIVRRTARDCRSAHWSTRLGYRQSSGQISGKGSLGYRLRCAHYFSSPRPASSGRCLSRSAGTGRRLPPLETTAIDRKERRCVDVPVARRTSMPYLCRTGWSRSSPATSATGMTRPNRWNAAASRGWCVRPGVDADHDDDRPLCPQHHSQGGGECRPRVGTPGGNGSP